MTTREPLLPCPFCGAKMAMRGDYTHDHAWNFYTHEDREERDNCILSQYEIPCGPDFITPTKSLTDAWNRRAMPLQQQMDICVDCEGPGVYPSGKPCKSCGGFGRVAKGDGIPVDSIVAEDGTK